MARGLPKGVYESSSGKFRAKVNVGRVVKNGTHRVTVAEAEADAAALREEQKAAKRQRIDGRDAAAAATRAAHADELAANEATYGGVQELDGLSRDLLKLALEGSHLAAADNAEYCKVDSSVYARDEGMGFDPRTDHELDEGVLTLPVQLKVTRSLWPHNGSMKNPQAHFCNVGHYHDKPGVVVLMMYVPPEVEAPVTAADLKEVKFWYEYGTSPKVKGKADYKPTLHGGNDPAGRPRPGRLLRDTIEREFANQKRRNGLVAYGDRARWFEGGDESLHAKGQAAIDAFRRQVLNPIGALLLPPEDGREGGAADARVHLAGAEAPRTAQLKLVGLDSGHTAGFKATLYRCHGSHRDADTGVVVKTYRSYRDGENDLYVFIALDARNNLAEYWCATEADMIGDSADTTERLVATADDRYGSQSIMVHPHPEDKERLGDTVSNSAQDGMAVRTRQWIRSLGPIVPPDEADALANTMLAAKRARHAEARAAALEARVDEVAAEAGPSNVNNNYNITNNNNNYHAPVIHISDTAARKRPLGSLDGWLLKK